MKQILAVRYFCWHSGVEVDIFGRWGYETKTNDSRKRKEEEGNSSLGREMRVMGVGLSIVISIYTEIKV